MDRDAICRAISLGGLRIPPDIEFEVSGDEPILASPHYLATGAAAARLLTGVGASELWRARTGRPQALAVDARHAAAALLSFLCVEFLDPSKRPGLDLRRANLALTSIFRAGGGRYVQLHGSFSDAPQVLDELGLADPATAEEIAAAVARRNALDLEHALMSRGLCGGVVMTKDEWHIHPQGARLGDLPVVRIAKIGEAPPRPLGAGDRPASGVRVLDLTRVLAGPTCAKTLAEHGADVLHVRAPHLGTVELFDVDTGIGKRQAFVDISAPGGAEVMTSLLGGADVFSQGYRLGTLEARGFGPTAVAQLRPGIVYVSENCYGSIGPWAGRPGWEQLAQAATGMSYREGLAAPGGEPRLAPAAVNDYSTGWLAAYGAMLALARRTREGGSWLVETSLAQTAMWYQRLGDDNDPAGAPVPDNQRFMREMDTPSYGRIRYLSPALSMTETEPGWHLPPAPNGTYEPEWLPR